jgi:DNA-binding transcriptional LysR family regulator
MRIGCVPYLPVRLLHAFLRHIEAHVAPPGVDVLHLRTAEQLSLLRSGALDVAVIYDVGEASGVKREPLFRAEPLAAFVPIDHALTERPVVTAADLERETLLLFPRKVDPALHDWYGSIVRTDGRGGLRHVGGADPRDVLLAVAEGHGIALAPGSLIHATGDLRALVTSRELAPAQLAPEIALAWSTAPPGGAQVYIDLARAAAREVHD